MAAHTRWANEDPREGTKAATAAGVTTIGYWAHKIDPDGALPEHERTRRAESARAAHYARMQLRSIEARKARAKVSP
ncbi:MAG TPA: hypothetical protein VG435_17225 [Acidimicrobiales bacterium]|jgi:hypothetical protein|nr:hypothetical protein [Acidimicrobiales bacterium]